MDRINRRLAKELTELITDPPAGIRFLQEQEGQANSNSNLMSWTLILEGARNTLYEGEIFQLQFRFGDDYPFSPPEALTASSVCLSILSMLSSCKKKERPPNDAGYVRYAPSSPSQTQWFFDDDEV
uniref:UBIQUITIN_CONJUGAT_2 domain-containing protein n=1 Tax=Globodera pallida TaxID=36090 RepID=A0A183CGC9_GLOPA